MLLPLRLSSYSPGPLPPSNLSAVLVTTSTVHLNWDTPPVDSVDGYTLNVTHNHSTKSRYVPNGKMTSYTVRDLQPGQRYRITVTALRNTPHGPVNSDPKTLRIQTGKYRTFLGAFMLCGLFILYFYWCFAYAFYCNMHAKCIAGYTARHENCSKPS